jgi:hypothetical protein
MKEESRVLSAQNATHWVAWVATPGDEHPVGGWTMVGQTREEAEERAREWWSKRSADTSPYPSPSSSSASSNMSPSEST